MMISLLPPDILGCLVSWLDPSSIVTLGQCNRRLRRLFRNKRVWHILDYALVPPEWPLMRKHLSIKARKSLSRFALNFLDLGVFLEECLRQGNIDLFDKTWHLVDEWEERHPFKAAIDHEALILTLVAECPVWDYSLLKGLMGHYIRKVYDPNVDEFSYIFVRMKRSLQGWSHREELDKLYRQYVDYIPENCSFPVSSPIGNGFKIRYICQSNLLMPEQRSATLLYTKAIFEHDDDALARLIKTGLDEVHAIAIVDASVRCGRKDLLYLIKSKFGYLPGNPLEIAKKCNMGHLGDWLSKMA